MWKRRHPHIHIPLVVEGKQHDIHTLLVVERDTYTLTSNLLTVEINTPHFHIAGGANA
jgi:hypothetical protein